MSKPQVVLTGESDGTLPLLPLKDIVVFPHMIIPVFINEDLCVSAVEEAVAGERKIFLSAFKIEDEKSDDTQGIIVNKALESTLDAPFDVYNIGTVCSIMRTRKLPDGRMKVLVQGLYKGRINRLERANPHPVVSVDKISDPAFETKSADIEAMI
nr:LON peptidase substrate-binding domain-containing protein [Oligoflexales bacterium]